MELSVRWWVLLMPRWLAENFGEMRIDGSFQPGLSHPARTLEPLFPVELCVS